MAAEVELGPPPLLNDTFALAEWVLQRFDRHGNAAVEAHPTLCSRLSGTVLTLLSSVTLALKGRLREERLDDADEALIALRMQLRLASALGAIEERQLTYALALADGVGRQLGGWQRSLRRA